LRKRDTLRAYGAEDQYHVWGEGGGRTGPPQPFAGRRIRDTRKLSLLKEKIATTREVKV